MDKEEQLSLWQDDGELGNVITGENLIHEYITFDPAGFLQDPQSPSAILDSLDDSATSSSNEQDLFPASSFEEAVDLALSGSFVEQNESLPAFLRDAEPVLGNGSVSDSELSQLEDICLKSLKETDMAPSSPPLIPQSSPTTSDLFADSVYATFRNATHRLEPSGTHKDISPTEAFWKESGSSQQMLDMFDYTTDQLDLKPEPIDSNGLPLSPPLSGSMSQSWSYTGNVPFVLGYLEDPFCDNTMVPRVSSGLRMSMSTPAMEDGFFISDELPIIDPNNAHIERPKQRNTSSAEWPTENITNDDCPRHWNPKISSYMPSGGAMHDPGWWEEPFTPVTRGYLQYHDNSAIRHAPVSFDHDMHHPHSDLSYDYTSDPSGLMMHTPQARLPQAAVLTVNTPEQLMTPSHRSHSSPRHPRDHYTEHRPGRPQSRAPSSGTRRHQHGSVTSPREPILHQTSSRKTAIHREDSASPSPSVHRPRRTTSASSISARKQRSWSRAPRTPNQGSRSGSFSGGGSPLGSGDGGIGFVNFTPGDKNLLMTGVAPSGSSKTKARREKEAADRRRRLSEAAVKAVQAAGGDLDRLVREGF